MRPVPGSLSQSMRRSVCRCMHCPAYTHPPMSDRSEELESRTRFEPAEVEPRIAAGWLQSGLFHPDPEGEAAENYSIAIPPPNVTGSLHMGHALNGSIQDVLIRYHRMAGRRTKWILGTDHAGIATQAQVEKALRGEGLTRQQLGREEFVRRVWEWREHYGHTIVEQLKRLGASCDYTEERFTLDEGYHRAVVAVFVALYEQGLDLPRPLHRQLGSWLALGDLRPRGGGAPRARHAVLDPLRPGGRRQRDDRHRATGDDAGRYRRGGAPRGRALPRVGRAHRDPAARRPSSAGDRRRVREDGVRHRPAEGHPRTRPQRLRDRPPPRARPGVGDRRGRAHVRRGRRALCRAHGDGGARGGGGGAAPGRPDRGGGGVRARSALLPPLRRADRAADLAAMVHAHGRARRARDRRRA